ncbi:MAG: carbohydrate kinase family protein [Eubacteriales bacterium]|jgi:pseudouridine kinase|nr:carbohydrate kinase family protein [Eubacteriales bacterium]
MIDRKHAFVAGVGAANVDVHGQSRKAIVMRDSNPGYMATSVGGVTRNILENLARQGVPVALFSAVGDDLFGEKIVRESRAAGIDMAHLLRKRGAASSSYIAILDERGDMLLGMSDMRIIEDLPAAYLDQNGAILQKASAIVCDACLPVALLDHLVSEAAGDTPVLIDPVSTAYARQMEPIAGKFYAIKPNEMELSILSGLPTETEAQIERACEALLDRGVQRVAVSRGEKGCYYADASGNRLFRALRPVSQMVNATGAGDAFMAGLTHALVDGMAVEEMLDYALASGITAIQSMTTINPSMSDALVRENRDRYRL